jgi:hypothetical protein
MDMPFSHAGMNTQLNPHGGQLSGAQASLDHTFHPDQKHPVTIALHQMNSTGTPCAINNK